MSIIASLYNFCNKLQLCKPFEQYIPKQRIVVLSANIAAGKTTLVNKLKQTFAGDYRVAFIEEPTNEWANFACENGLNIFENYYNNKTAWAFKFQLYALCSRANAIRKAMCKNKNAQVFVIERSPDDDFEIFASMLHDQGFISNDDFAILKTVRQEWTLDLQQLIHFHIYLKVSVENCWTRIQLRNRRGEEGIDLNFLRAIEERLNQWPMKNKYELDADCALDSPEYPQLFEAVKNAILLDLN